MRVWDINHKRQVLIRTSKYLIDWENDGASKLEKRFIELIYPYWKNKQILYQCRIPGSLLRLDFLNATNRLVVEINGPQHGTFNRHFHRNSRSNFLFSIKRDISKVKWAEDNNLQLLELEEDDLDDFSPERIQERFGINIT